jgi:transcription termination factor Rho
MNFKELSLADLRVIAKEKGLKGISALKKGELIERLENAEREQTQAGQSSVQYPEQTSPRTRENHSYQQRETNAYQQRENHSYQQRETNSYPNRENGGNPARTTRSYNPNFDPNDISSLDSGEVANGILEVMPDGFGFIRCANYLPGDHDVYVSPAQIRRFNLKTGDILKGNMRIKTEREKFSALLYVTGVNGFSPAEAQRRPNFEDMTPIFPNERIRLESYNSSVPMRMVDLLSPIGKGQRGMIVSPPKTGKTTILKEIAKSISRTYPDMNLIVLLIDERPEEVTDIRESIEGPNVEVIYSTFDELPEHHKRVSEMVLERAKRLVEHKKDVVILLDSITRLARAYNLTVPPSGRTLTGGLDPAALHMPKKFFGAARNMREGGSLTILATALVDTGSKMDDVVFEEFKGTGNMELVLDRKLSEKRIFPAVNIQKSSTRRDDLLLTPEEQEVVYTLHKELSGQRAEENLEQILNFFMRTKNNKEFIQVIQKSIMKR